MRLRGRWLVGAIAIAIALVVAVRGDWRGRGDSAAPMLEGEGARSFVYEVPADGFLAFDIPSAASRLRLHTNANLAPSARVDALQGDLPYSLRLEFLDWRGGARSERDYHFRTRMRSANRTDSASLISSQRYLRSELQPLDSRVAQLRLDEVGFRPAQLRVHLDTLDEALDGLVVRIYYREQLFRGRWQRLTETEKEVRALGNAYPHDLLTDSEKGAIASHVWSPVPPSGLLGRDYRRRVLVQPEARPVSIPLAGPQLTGLVAPPGVPSVLRIAGAATVHLRLSAADGSDLATGDVEFRWLGRDGTRREDLDNRVEDGALVLSADLDVGWLELLPRVRVALKGTLSGEEPFVVPEPESVLAFRCDPNTSLAYFIAHVGARSTPVRIDLRAKDPSATEDSMVTLRFIDRDGATVTEKTHRHGPSLSAYDWIDGPEGPERTGDIERVFLEVPASVQGLVVAGCTSPTLVSVYNRPPDLELMVRLPQQDHAPSPRWFLMRPLDARERAAAGETHWLRVQTRPRATAPAELSLSTETYEPREELAGRHILTPRTLPWAGRRSALASSYVELQEGEMRELGFESSRAGAPVEARLLHRRPGNTPFRLRVEVDGDVVLDEERVGRQGELRLPPFAEGPHRIHPLGDGSTSFFVSHVEDPESSFVRRWVSGLPDEPFEMEVDKAGALVLTGRLYFPGDPPEGCSIRVELRGQGRPSLSPLDDWTFFRRRYEFGHPVPDHRVSSLGDDQLWLLRSEPFFVRLGRDLADGSYFARFEPHCGTEAYVTLSRLTSEELERRGFFLDSEPIGGSTGALYPESR